MEIKADNYLINYYANLSDFKIIIYNNINNKKYETVKTSDDYKIYKDIGLDIFEIIKNCLDNNTFTINDNNDYLTLELSYKELTKISINCDIIRIDKKEIELIDLKKDIYELKNIIQNQNIILENLKKDNDKLKNIVKYHNNSLTKLVTIDNTIFHKDIQEIHINKLTKTYKSEYWYKYYNFKLNIPCILLDESIKDRNKAKNYILINITRVQSEYTNTTKEFSIDTELTKPQYYIFKTPQFRQYHKYPEIPKIYFSDTIKIKELTDNLQNLDVIGISYFDISHDDIINLLNLKNLTQINFYKCNFIDITREKIRLMFGQIHVIFSV